MVSDPAPSAGNPKNSQIELSSTLRSTTRGMLIWLGEAIIGLLPLLAHELVAAYSVSAPGHESARVTAEVCILSVVISGLALLSLLPYGQGHRRPAFSAWTYLLCLVMVLSLIFGTLFYALETVGASLEANGIIWYILGTTVIGSLGLSLEAAIRDEPIP